MTTGPEHDKPVVTHRFGQPIKQPEPPDVKQAEENVDDQSPLTLDEILDIGKQAWARIRGVPLKPVRRGVRTAADDFMGMVEGAAGAVENKGRSKKGREE